MIISHSSPIPVYKQIVDQIIKMIDNGQLKEGEMLPSVRQLSKQAGIANNTVVKAYDDLELKGLIKRYSNKGAFVLGKSDTVDEDALYTEISTFLNPYLKQGLDPNHLKRILYRIITDFDSKY